MLIFNDTKFKDKTAQLKILNAYELIDSFYNFKRAKPIPFNYL